MNWSFYLLKEPPPSLIPQMSPMNWLFLYLLFSFCLSMVSSKISLMND